MSLRDRYEAAKAQHAKTPVETTEPSVPSFAGSLQKYAETRALISEQQRAREAEETEAKKPEGLRTGQVYFLLNTGPGSPKRVKIGWTSGLIEKRIRELSTGAAYPLKYLASVPAQVKAEEGYWHTRFDEYRCVDAGGDEWFRLEGKLLEFLKTLNSELKNVRGSYSKKSGAG
jgi:hypothetical protein